jgi:phage gp29-like protein
MQLPEPLTRLGAAIGGLFAAAPPKPSGAARAGLLSEQAVDAFLDGLIGSADPDQVLRKIGKTRADMRILEGDDEVAAALETRANAVLSTPWRLEPGESDVAKFITEQLTPHAESLIFDAWHAVPYGYSVIEAVYQRLEGDRIGLARLVQKPFEWFEPRRDGALLYRPTGRSQVVPVDTRFKFFLTRRNASYRNPRGEALLSRAYWPWFLRSAGWRFFARFIERHSAPLLIGKTAGDKAAMARALAAAVQSGAIGIGQTDTVESVNAGNTGEAFDRYDERCNRRIQKLILGQTLTTEMGSGGGSYAAAKVQDGVRADRKVADLRMVRKTMQQVIDALVALNFPGQASPVFTWDEGVDLATARAERDAKLATAGVVKFTEQYLLDRYDFEPGDIEIPSGLPLDLGGGEGDEGKPGAKPVPKPKGKGGKFSAELFAATRFTPYQEAVEALGDEGLRLGGQPVDPAVIRNAVREATSPDDLVERLARLYDAHPPEEFALVLDRALFAADVLGYAHAAQTAIGAEE